MLVREGNKIVRNKRTLEKATRVKDIHGLENDFFDSFVKPLYAELKKVLPKGMEPDIEYDLDACHCALDARSLGQKAKDLLSLKGWNGGIHEIATVVRNKDLDGYLMNCKIQLHDGSNFHNGVMGLKEAIAKVVGAYEKVASTVKSANK